MWFKLKFINKRDLITSLVLYGLFVYALLCSIIGFRIIEQTNVDSVIGFAFYFSLSIMSFLVSVLLAIILGTLTCIDICLHMYCKKKLIVRVKEIFFIIGTVVLFFSFIADFNILILCLFLGFLILSIILVRMVKQVDTSDLESDS